MYSIAKCYNKSTLECRNVGLSKKLNCYANNFAKKFKLKEQQVAVVYNLRHINYLRWFVFYGNFVNCTI